MLLDFTTQSILIYRQIMHSLPFKIKDLDFFPQRTRTFVTCGAKHLCFWS